MRNRGLPNASREVAAIALMVAIALIHGCPPVAPAEYEGEGSRPGLWQGVLGELEPNNEFAAAMPVHLTDKVHIEGNIEFDSDYDVYALGSLGERTHLHAALELPVEGKMTICIFDEQECLLARTSLNGPQQSRTIDLILPEPALSLYLLAYTAETGFPCTYAATLSLREPADPFELRPQVVVLNFEGARDVTVAGRIYSEIPAFDAANIDPRYAGQTDEIIRLLLEHTRADYAGVGVEIFLASDPAVPAGEHSIVYYGGANPDLLGVADGVDQFNSQVVQPAIVYTDTFSVFSSLDPSPEMMAQILANVTSHEIGHLLGLRHTADPEDLMDITATARRLLADQWFKRARLHSSVSPLGYQDSPAALSRTVGGQLALQPTRTQRPVIAAGGPGDFDIPRGWLSGHCSCD